MWWRVRKGERFMQIHGAEAKRRQKALVLAGKSHGLIAFAGDEPVGWCAYGQRTEFSALGRSRTLACDDAEEAARMAIERHQETHQILRHPSPDGEA